MKERFLSIIINGNKRHRKMEITSSLQWFYNKPQLLEQLKVMLIILSLLLKRGFVYIK